MLTCGPRSSKLLGLTEPSYPVGAALDGDVCLRPHERNGITRQISY